VRSPAEPRCHTAQIFNHLDGAGERRWFSAIARELHDSPWWREVTPWSEPRAVNGEIEVRR